MSTYNPLVPTGLINLDTDYKNLQLNFQQADTTFGVDHYKFSDVTVNNGFHKSVTTPDQGSAPVTTTSPKIYGLQQTAPMGVLQYSKGPANQVPNPITWKQSTGAGIVINHLATTPVMNFTGLALCTGQLAILDFFGLLGSAFIGVVWNGTSFLFFPNNFTLQAQDAGAGQLNIVYAGFNFGPLTIFWTFIPYRTQ